MDTAWLLPYLPTLITVGVALLLVLAVGAWLRIRDQRSTLITDPQVAEWAAYFVRAAEQMFPGDNAAKLDYVLDMIDLLYPAFNQELARAIVEALVYQLKQAQPPAKAYGLTKD